MILITGGSYQGKLEFARRRFELSSGDIQLCTEDTLTLETDRRCIAYIEQFALGCVRREIEPAELFRASANALNDSVIVTADISCGVVPVDPVLRAWREACGRMNNDLAARADEVWRLFCGIPQQIK